MDGRVEVVFFASSKPVLRETLSRLVGRDCSIDLLIDDIREELRDRPYKLVSVAGGWHHRTRTRFADAIRSVTGVESQGRLLSQADLLVLVIVAYHQPITRGEISKISGKENSGDTIAHLRSLGFISNGRRSPQPGAPYTLVTTKTLLSQFGLGTLRDPPDIASLEDSGLLSGEWLFGENIPIALEDGEAIFERDGDDNRHD